MRIQYKAKKEKEEKYDPADKFSWSEGDVQIINDPKLVARLAAEAEKRRKERMAAYEAEQNQQKKDEKKKK